MVFVRPVRAPTAAKYGVRMACHHMRFDAGLFADLGGNLQNGDMNTPPAAEEHRFAPLLIYLIIFLYAPLYIRFRSVHTETQLCNPTS